MNMYIEFIDILVDTDTVVIVQENHDKTWTKASELIVTSVKRRTKPSFLYRLNHDHNVYELTCKDLARLSNSNDFSFVLERVIPEDVLFQCRLSGNYAEAIRHHGFTS